MIDFEKYYALVVQFLSNNILITIALIVAIIVGIYKKPEGTIKFLGFCFFLAAVVYIMSLLGESGSLGVDYKKGGLEQSENVLQD
jgi:hypothetical protein